jgi:hypothetical protein
MILVVLADLFLSQVNGSISQVFANHIPAIVAGSIIVILAGIRINYFSYEDEYEIIHIRSKSLLFGSFESAAQTRYEFPKRIIYDFDYRQNLLRKQLTIYIITQQGTKKVRKFNLSFVPVSKLRYVIQSLENIRKQNKELHKSNKLEWS